MLTTRAHALKSGVMIIMMFLLAVARGETLPSFVLQRVALLHLAERATDPEPMSVTDTDRWYVTVELERLEYAGAIRRVLERPGLVATAPAPPTGRELIAAFARDGYAGEWPAVIARLTNELVASGWSSHLVCEALKRHVLIPGAGSIHLRTEPAARVQLHLVHVLGRLRVINARPALVSYLRGVTAAWTDFAERPEFRAAVDALVSIEAERAPAVIADVTGWSIERTRDWLSPPAACAALITAGDAPAGGGRLRRWLRAWRGRPPSTSPR